MEMDMAAVAAAAAEPGDGTPVVPAVAPATQKLKLTADEYAKITGWVLLKIKHVGHADVDGDQDMDQQQQHDGGIRKSVIVADWLEHKESQGELESEEDFELERKKLNGVLTRLVKKENMLLEIQDDTVPAGELLDDVMDGGVVVKDPILVLHPNFA
ncbi:UNVERIFIED_CONTAM: hypothetical protein HDU68_004132 [Siphonaria sp. JEL0065]|nr:hypothetical protein HDU68_004132 [Siphonaria sp. JEL0065]